MKTTSLASPCNPLIVQDPLGAKNKIYPMQSFIMFNLEINLQQLKVKEKVKRQKFLFN